MSRLLPVALVGIVMASAALACDRGRRQLPQLPTPTAPAGADQANPPALPTTTLADPALEEAAPPTQAPAEPLTEVPAPPTEVPPQPPAEDPLGDEIEALLDQLVDMNEAADPLDDLP